MEVLTYKAEETPHDSYILSYYPRQSSPFSQGE